VNQQNDKPSTRSRRRIIGVAAGLGLSSAGVVRSLAAAEALQDTDATGTPTLGLPLIGRVRAPTWTFVVHAYADPYPGTTQGGSALPPDARIVGLEAEITNDSPNALPFYPSNLHLRTDDGLDYFNFQLYGSEPRLTNRTLARGETARGWVWFGVPEGTRLVQIVFLAPPPELAIEIPT